MKKHAFFVLYGYECSMLFLVRQKQNCGNQRAECFQNHVPHGVEQTDVQISVKGQRDPVYRNCFNSVKHLVYARYRMPPETASRTVSAKIKAESR